MCLGHWCAARKARFGVFAAKRSVNSRSQLRGDYHSRAHQHQPCVSICVCKPYMRSIYEDCPPSSATPEISYYKHQNPVEPVSILVEVLYAKHWDDFVSRRGLHGNQCMFHKAGLKRTARVNTFKAYFRTRSASLFAYSAVLLVHRSTPYRLP